MGLTIISFEINTNSELRANYLSKLYAIGTNAFDASTNLLSYLNKEMTMVKMT